MRILPQVRPPGNTALQCLSRNITSAGHHGKNFGLQLLPWHGTRPQGLRVNRRRAACGRACHFSGSGRTTAGWEVSASQWNVTSHRRTCALASVSLEQLSTQDCARAILNRWGASENTFKHLANRHPLHYQPGFAFVESEKQKIANPAYKEKKGLLKRIFFMPSPIARAG